MDMFFEAVNNSLVQSLILGPLMGVVFAALFSGFTSSPTNETPVTYVQTKHVYVTKVVERRTYRNSNTDDGRGIAIILGVGLLFILWKYAIYASSIHQYVAILILSVMSFSLTTILISFFKGQYTSNEWWIYTITPLIFLSVSMYLLLLAKTSFDPRITQGALSNTFFTFYTKWLSGYGRNFMITHVIGVLVLCMAVILTASAQLHYLSLMNQRTHGHLHGFWFSIARVTSPFSGSKWVYVVVFLLSISYVGINPSLAAMWLTN